MPVWEILELVEPEESEEHLRTWFIEIPRGARPASSTQGDLFTMDIKGWVVGRHARATAVELVYHNHVIRTAPVRGARADLAPAFPDLDPQLDMHFHSMIGVVGLRPEFELDVQAVLENGMRVPMAHIRARHEPLRTGYDPLIRPIVLTCLGRSGTTWVMRMLRHHPEVVVYDRHPYEQTYAKYWMHMLRVLSQPADHINSYEEETFHNEIFELGYNPFYDVVVSQQKEAREWFGREYVERLGALLPDEHRRPLHDDRRSTGPGAADLLRREAPVAELHPGADVGDLSEGEGDLPGARLPRHGVLDPRVRPQAGLLGLRPARGPQRRGLRAHGAARDGAQPAQELDHPPRPRAPGALRGSRPQPRRHGARHLEYLELDASPEQVKRLLAAGVGDSDELRHHRTSERAEESIGRWRREGDERFRELCNDVFGDILGDFGYSEVGYVG